MAGVNSTNSRELAECLHPISRKPAGIRLFCGSPAQEGRATAHWFWRTYDQQEIDLIEERPAEDALAAFEFKWNATKRVRLPKVFLETDPHAETAVVTPETVGGFLLG
jgi:hypothetical protein